MAPPSFLKHGIYQPGFRFSTSLPFETAPDSVPIYDTLFGTDRPKIALETLKQRATGLLGLFFSTLLEFEGLYLATRGSSLFWETVVNDFNYHAGSAPLEWRLAKKLAEVYGKARLEQTDKSVETDLTRMVDKFIGIDRVVTTMAPAAGQINLTINTHPGDVNALASAVSGADFGLSQPAAPPAVEEAKPWPPTHFAARDLVFLARNEVRTQLQGITSDDHGGQQRQPLLPHKRSSGIDLRVFLGYAALTTSTPEKQWSLFPAPIAFVSNDDRREWFRHTAKQSQFFESMSRFLEYALKSFQSGKTTVIGMLTPWLVTVGFLTAAGGSDAWSKGDPRAVRVGMALVLRRSGDPGAEPRLQIALFDPWFHYPAAKTVTKLHGSAVFDFRRRLRDMLVGWVKANAAGPTTINFWSGGRLSEPRPYDAEKDGVELAALFVDELVRDKGIPPWNQNSEVEDQQMWKMRGFDKVQGDDLA